MSDAASAGAGAELPAIGSLPHSRVWAFLGLDDETGEPQFSMKYTGNSELSCASIALRVLWGWDGRPGPVVLRCDSRDYALNVSTRNTTPCWTNPSGIAKAWAGHKLVKGDILVLTRRADHVGATLHRKDEPSTSRLAAVLEAATAPGGSASAIKATPQGRPKKKSRGPGPSGGAARAAHEPAPAPAAGKGGGEAERSSSGEGSSSSSEEEEEEGEEEEEEQEEERAGAKARRQPQLAVTPTPLRGSCPKAAARKATAEPSAGQPEQKKRKAPGASPAPAPAAPTSDEAAPEEPTSTGRCQRNPLCIKEAKHRGRCKLTLGEGLTPTDRAGAEGLVGLAAAAAQEHPGSPGARRYPSRPRRPPVPPWLPASPAAPHAARGTPRARAGGAAPAAAAEEAGPSRPPRPAPAVPRGLRRRTAAEKGKGPAAEEAGLDMTDPAALFGRDASAAARASYHLAYSLSQLEAAGLCSRTALADMDATMPYDPIYLYTRVDYTQDIEQYFKEREEEEMGEDGEWDGAWEREG
eukprot:scaffold20.g7674.t1